MRRPIYRLRAALPSIALASLLFAGCATAPPAAVPPPASKTGKITAATRWFATSAEQEAAYRQAFQVAARVLEVKAPGLDPGHWAVVIDGDETVLDNVAYQVWMNRSGQPFSLDTWNDWVRREEAVALPGVVTFLRRVRELGGVIAIVSNREEEVRDATESNLRAEGIPWDVMLLRAGTSDKAARFRALEEGTASPELPPLSLVMFLGDNIQDFPDMTQAVRGQGAEAFADFGVRYFVVPNPTYGSWERNPLPTRLRDP